MTQPQAPAGVRRMMTAASQLLVGASGDIENPAFGRNLILIVGCELNPVQTFRIAQFAHANQRNVAHLAFGCPENPDCPRVTFAHYAAAHVTVYEACVLWASDDKCPVHIVRPDAGVAFQMTRSQRVKRRRSPVASWDEAVAGGRRAMDRLYGLADSLDESQLVEPLLPTTH